MSTKVYNKLVRDGIPEIIEATGKRASCEFLSDARYLEMLEAKLSEELAEYRVSKELEELADILEVIDALAVAKGSSVAELENIRRKKAAERGGFEKRIFLKDVVEN